MQMKLVKMKLEAYYANNKNGVTAGKSSNIELNGKREAPGEKWSRLWNNGEKSGAEGIVNQRGSEASAPNPRVAANIKAEN